MDDIRTIFENLDGNTDPETVKALFRAALNERMYKRLGMEHIDTTFRIWEEGEIDAAAAVGSPDDTVLDPTYDKEFFLKTFDVGEHSVVVKTLGVGRNKPVSVYIDNERWELFPGPGIAEKETTTFIKSGKYAKMKEMEAAADQADADAAKEEEKEEDNTLSEHKDILGILSEIKNKKQRVTFRDGGSLLMDPNTAKSVLAVYEALNTRANRNRFADMANRSRSTFRKLVSFANQQMRNIK